MQLYSAKFANAIKRLNQTGAMTRIGAIVLILSLSLPAHSARKAGDCQGDLFSSATTAAPERHAKAPTFERYSDLPFLQKRIWALEAEGKMEQAEFMRRRLEIQLTLTRKNKEVAKIGRHQLLQATDISLALFRADDHGKKEIAAYELNEKLGRPVKIPVTVRHHDGSLQLWLFYDHKDEMLSQAEHDRLTAKIAADHDLFLFNFLVSNTDQHSQNLVLDRDAGVVVFDFGAGFRFSVQNYMYFSLPKEQRTKALEDITREDVELILREKLAGSKFDWQAALNGLDMESVAGSANRLLGSMNSRDLAGRICFLRAVANGVSSAHCPFP